MKYFKVNYQSIVRELHEKGLECSIGSANGIEIPNARELFNRMAKGKINNLPLLDYFFLQHFGPQSEWEFRKQDVHGFIVEYPTGGAWFISNDCKLLFDNFKMGNDCNYYKSKLLYKGVKYDYWVWQYSLNDHDLNSEIYYNISNCEFWLGEDVYTGFETRKTYNEKCSEIRQYTNNRFKLKKMILTSDFDFVPNKLGDMFISERLKIAIEQMGLTGFEFGDLDFEVVLLN